MKCDEIRIKLSEYLDGELSSDERKLVDEHLADCEVCRGALAELERTVGHLRSIEEVEPPHWFTQKVMQRVREESGKKGLLRWLFFPLRVKIPVEALAVALVAVAAMYVFNAIKPEVRMKVAAVPVAEAPAPAKPEEGVLALGNKVKEEAPSEQKIPEQGGETEDRVGLLRKSAELDYRAKKSEAVTEKAYAPPAMGEGAASAKGGDMMDGERVLKESYAEPEKELGYEERIFKISVSARDIREAREAVEVAVKKVGGRLVEETAEQSIVMAEVASARLTELIRELETIGEVSAETQALPGDYSAVRIELKEKP